MAEDTVEKKDFDSENEEEDFEASVLGTKELWDNF